MSLLDQERATYDTVWTSIDRYGDLAPGEQYLPIFLQIVGSARGTVLDAGTGSGKGALALGAHGFFVVLCDVTDAGLVEAARDLPFRSGSLWHPLRPLLPTGSVDWVYCTDVLEHVPPQFTMLAVEQMLRVARRGVFLSVSLVPDAFGAWVGRPLHQTVQPFLWWRDALAELGAVTDARDLRTSATFYVERTR